MNARSSTISPASADIVRRGAGCGLRLAGARRRARQLRLRRLAEASLAPKNAALLRPSTRTRATSEATSTWRGTASARASTATSNIHFLTSSLACERRYIRTSPP